MRLPRFTIRDLFWLVLVCALITGWWREHRFFTREGGLYHQDHVWQVIADYGDTKTQDAVVDLVIEHYPVAEVRKRLESDRSRFRSLP